MRTSLMPRAASACDQFHAFGHRRGQHQPGQARALHQFDEFVGEQRRGRIAGMDLQAEAGFAARREHAVLHADDVVRVRVVVDQADHERACRCAGCARTGRARSRARRSRAARARACACITEGSLLITRETVFSETLARSATSLMVGLRMFSSAMSCDLPMTCAHHAATAALPDAVSAQGEEQDVQVARHHERSEHQLEIVMLLQHARTAAE